MNIIDLRDLRGKERTLWKKEIEEQTGYDFKELMENEPIMIDSDDFEEYAQELAEDIGAIDRNSVWPNNCIDWEKAADELQYDYSSVDIDGKTYYFRSY